MKLKVTALIGVLLGAIISESSGMEPMQLVKNERAFAATVAAEGIRAGFLENISDSGVLFVPAVVNGKEYYEKSPQRPGLLSWGPAHAEIAAGDNIGWTTGPWEFRRESVTDTPIAYGHYVTLWKQQTDSSWKFALDIGISHGKGTAVPSDPNLQTLSSANSAKPSDPREAQSELLRLEKLFSKKSATGAKSEAYLAHAASDIRLYREGEPPHHGTAELETTLKAVDGFLSWQANFVEVSRSGALGYSFGVSSLASGDSTSEFSYTHIWRRNSSGEWKLALDIQIPLSTD